MTTEEEKTPFWALILEKTMFCESGTWIERIFIALALGALGSLLLFGLYSLGWMSSGFLRGFVGWMCFTVFYAKAINLFSCGGPIPSAIFGFPVILVLEMSFREGPKAI